MSKFKAGDNVVTVGSLSKTGIVTTVLNNGKVVIRTNDGVERNVETKNLAPQEVGLKYDNGKPDLTLVNKELVEAAARGMTYGLKNYGRNNYKNFTKDDIIRFEAALLRHMFAHLSGEIKDKESGNDHLDHVASTLNIILWLKNNK